MSLKLKRYLYHQDTGLPWASRVPSHWNIVRLKYLFEERVEKGFPRETLLTATQTYGVIPKTDYGIRTVEAMKDLHLLKLVQPGDYVISLRSFQGGIEYAHHRGIISPAYTVLQPTQEVKRSYFEHFFKSNSFINSMSLFVTGIREGQNIDYTRLSRAYMPVPPLEEQDAIGRFIRYIDHRVNRLLKAKRRLIELLNEQKQAIIHQAVTRGLDPTVPLKPSGIEWLGDVPEHWEIKPVKYLASFSGGGTPSKANLDFWNGEIPWVSPKDMKAEWIEDSEDHISQEALDSSATTMVAPGSVLMVVRSGILKRTIPISINTRAVSLNQDMKAVLFNSLLKPEYFVLIVRGCQNRLLPLWRKSGATVESIEHRYLANTELALPPPHEQQAIVEYLNEATQSVSLAITKAQAEIDFIREYRTRLVSDVVTGQLDVRGLALPESDEEESSEVLEEAMEEGDDEMGDAGEMTDE